MKEPSYLLAFLTGRANVLAAIGMLGAGVLASIPFGGDGLALAGLVWAAGEILACATVPGIPMFQRFVQREARREELQETATRLLKEIDGHGGSRYVREYERMVLRLESLRRIAKDSSSTLSDVDLEQIEGVPVDYLKLCLRDAVTRDEGEDRSSERVLAAKLRDIEKQLEAPGLSKSDRAQLVRAQEEFRVAAGVPQRLATRRSLLEAQLLSMPAQFEEMYQMVVSNPGNKNFGEVLGESVRNLRGAEEASTEVDDLLSGTDDAGKERVDRVPLAFGERARARTEQR